MKLLISKEEYDYKKGIDKIPLECLQCKKIHYRTKTHIKRILTGDLKNTTKGNFCSHKCKNNYRRNSKIYNCIICKKEVERTLSEISSTKNIFCGHSCSAKYTNTHKTFGYRRSKLEIWLEEQLSKLYPTIEIHFNRIDTINAELDIYIPSLKLAFELNGIFHYEPIYSEDKLKKTQNNDQRKFQACLEKKIELCVIDTSSQRYFKEKNSQKFLSIITEIINKKYGAR